MKQTALMDLHYLPSLEYFCCLNKFDKILIEKEEHFIKQTYRNRCHILGANKVERLVVPVVGGNKKIKIKDIKIDHNQKWTKIHWRAIQSAYGKAPFFEYFADYYEAEFGRKEKFLFELNYKLLTLCLRLLRMDTVLEFTGQYMKSTEANVVDLRSVIHPKKDFRDNGFYQPQSYQQVFGKGFVANLSIVDLLFCEGPNAANMLQQSVLTK